MPPPIVELQPRMDLAVAIAQEAGRLTLDYFRRDDLLVLYKNDRTPVTEADRKAEEHLRRRIAEAFPDDGLLGEEFADQQPGTSGFRWIIDPIDGTKSFIHGIPLYSNLVAVEWREESVVGVINVPALEECVYAGRGLGAWHLRGQSSPKPARVSQRISLATSLFLVSEVLCFDQTGRRGAYDRVQSAAAVSRPWGDGYGYLMGATGRAEVMIDPCMSLWDVAPMPTILEEAGGTLTDWKGNPTHRAGEAIATNGLVLAEVLRAVAPAEA